MDSNGTKFHLLLGREDWGACFEVRQPGGEPASSLLGDLTFQLLRDTACLSQSLKTKSNEPDPENPSPASAFEYSTSSGELTLASQLFQFAASTSDAAPRLEDRRGAARDKYGNWYWIDVDGKSIRVVSAGTRNASRFWPSASPAPCEQLAPFAGFHATTHWQNPEPQSLAGLAVTEDHYLVVGTLEPAGLLVFDLHSGGPPQQILWPGSIPFVPFDMAAAPGGGVWILDRANRRYWSLDRQLRVVRAEQAQHVLQAAGARLFRPVSGAEPRMISAISFPTGISLDAAAPLADEDPVAIEALPDGTVLILDRPRPLPADATPPGSIPPEKQRFSVIRRYRLGTLVGEPLSLSVLQIKFADTSTTQLLGYDFAFVPEHTDADGALVLDTLFVADSGGNQSFAFLISRDAADKLVLRPQADYLPMRRFGGKALVAADCQAYYDFGTGWIPLIRQPRPRYAESALFVTPISGDLSVTSIDSKLPRRGAFDGDNPLCVWHRVMIDGCIPPESSLRLWSRAADSERDLQTAPWRAEPTPYLRGDGSELPFQNSKGPGIGRGTWELLLQSARGRYLQLAIQLTGNGRVTPRLRALRVYAPRFSYAEQYLPAVYREDVGSASFLERFLANFEGFYTTLEDKIAAVQTLFDVRSAPAEVLDWLSGWFGVVLDPAWDETRRRLFLKHAMEFFRCRGTRRGLQMALRLVLDTCPSDEIFLDPFQTRGRKHPIRIIESFRTRRISPQLLGDPTEPVGPRTRHAAQRWSPADSGAALHERYSSFLESDALSGGAIPSVLFPLVPPARGGAGWQAFAESVLGFVPSAGPGDLVTWRQFLVRRYGRLSALNTAWRSDWSSFENISLPSALPADGPALVDWYQFERVVLAMRRTAHRFTVLLPAPVVDTPDRATERMRIELARRVIELEKPVQTRFDVRSYWAQFGVGSVRLGDDTILDLGSRNPRLLPGLLLGQTYLAGAVLAPGHPYNISDRRIVGRDAPTF